MGESAGDSPPAPSRQAAAILWLALAVALSPVLWDLLHHWIEYPWSRYSLLFPALLWWLARRQEPAAAATGSGLALVLIGTAVCMLALAGGVVRAARPGLVLAVIGLCRYTGTTSLRTALLAAWLVPVPHLLAQAVNDATGGGLVAVAAALATGIGVEVTWDPDIAAWGAEELALLAAYGGLPLAALFTGLTWFGAARRRLPGRETLLRLLGAALLALPVQLAALLAAFGLLAAGWPAGGRFLLLHALWPVCAVGALWIGHRSAR